MKFGQFIEYNMGNIFFEKSYIKYDGETIPRSKVLHILILLYGTLRAVEIYWN